MQTSRTLREKTSEQNAKNKACDARKNSFLLLCVQCHRAALPSGSLLGVAILNKLKMRKCDTKNVRKSKTKNAKLQKKTSENAKYQGKRGESARTNTKKSKPQEKVQKCKKKTLPMHKKRKYKFKKMHLLSRPLNGVVCWGVGVDGGRLIPKRDTVQRLGGQRRQGAHRRDPETRPGAQTPRLCLE